MKTKRNSAITQKPNPTIACTREGVAFWITESQLDTIFEAMEIARNLQASYLEGSIDPEPDDVKAEFMFEPMDKYSRFHRVLVDLKERRGDS